MRMPTPRRHSPAPVPTDVDRGVVSAGRQVALDTVGRMRTTLLDDWGSARRRDKADGTPVTVADEQADARLVAAIRDHFPDHAVVSEEGETTWDGSAWTWIIDPIDGTTNYAAGLPYWATSIALAHAGEVVWGLVDMPALGRRMEATRGAGTVLDGRRVHVADAVDLGDHASRHVPMGVTAGTIRQVQSGTYFKPRVLGACAVDLAMVAAGTLGAAFARVPRAWDVAAGILCVTEAGGSVVEVDQPGNLPLQEGRDCDDHAVRTAAGPDAEWLTDAVARMWPDH